jgi:hypothetical protein
MTAAEALKALNKTLKANAARPVATLPLMDRGRCTAPNCDCCRKGKR